MQLNAKWGRRENKQQEETAAHFCDERLSLKRARRTVDRGAQVHVLLAREWLRSFAAKRALKSHINQHKANKNEKSGADLDLGEVSTSVGCALEETLVDRDNC